MFNVSGDFILLMISFLFAGFSALVTIIWKMQRGEIAEMKKTAHSDRKHFSDSVNQIYVEIKDIGKTITELAVKLAEK